MARSRKRPFLSFLRAVPRFPPQRHAVPVFVPAEICPPERDAIFVE
jgi:hypothetical protein